MNKVLIIKMGDTFPWLSKQRGNFEDWIKAGLGIDYWMIAVAKPYEGQVLPDPRCISGVVISGSHAMVTERPRWSERTARWIRQAADIGIPLLGICYGHQLLAYAMGGNVGDTPKGLEFGTAEIFLTKAAEQDPLFHGLPNTMGVQVSHTQSVLALPANAMLLASNSHEPHHAFVIGNRAWGVQFHPEFDAVIVRAYVKTYAKKLRKEGKNPDTLLQEITDSPYGKIILQRFGEIIKQESNINQ